MSREEAKKISSLNTSNDFKYRYLYSKRKKKKKATSAGMEMTYQIRITGNIVVFCVLFT